MNAVITEIWSTSPIFHMQDILGHKAIQSWVLLRDTNMSSQKFITIIWYLCNHWLNVNWILKCTDEKPKFWLINTQPMPMVTDKYF